MNLYQTSELATLQNHIDAETGEIDIEAFNNANIALADKQKAVCAYIKNEDVKIGAIDEAIKQLMNRKSAMVKQRNNLHEDLLSNMQHHGITEITADDFTFSAKIKKNPAKLVIDDAGKIPTNLYIYPDAPPPKPDNAAIKALLKDGETVDGARLEQGLRLEIK